MAEQSNQSKMIRGISSQTLVTIVLGIVEIVSFSIMSRLLTKQDFGYFAAITAVVTVFSCFSETGIGAAIIQRKIINKRYIDNAFTLSLLFGLFASISLLIFAGPIAVLITDESMSVPLRLMSVTLLFGCITSINFSIMYRRLQFLRVGIIQLFSLIVTSIVAIILAIKGYGYYAIITRALLSSVLTLIISFIFAKTKYGLALDKQTFKQIFGFSGWLMASGLFRNLAHDIDKLVMSRLLSVASLGAYNRPKDLIGQISSKLNGIFDTALFPVLSGIQDDKAKMKTAFLKSFYFMNIFAMLITLTLALNSELFIRVFFGEQWMDLKLVAIILSFLMLFNIDGRLADCFMRSLAMTRQQFYFRILETIITLAGVIIGSKWDIVGVALGVVITNSFLKLFKIAYISYKMELSLKHVVAEILSSWQFILFMLPLTLAAVVALPNTLVGNLVLLVWYVILSLLVFLMFPSVVGSRYKETAYKNIKSNLLRQISKFKQNNQK